MSKKAKAADKKAQEAKKANAPENQSYSLTQEVPLTGENFLQLKGMIETIRRDMMENTPTFTVRLNEKGEEERAPVYSKYLLNIEGIARFLNDIHKQNVEKGITIPIEEHLKELEEAAKKENQTKKQ